MAIKEQSMIQGGLTRILCPNLLTVWFWIGHSAPLSLFLTWKIQIIMVIELLWDQTEAPIMKTALQFSSVQPLSCVWLFVTPWTAAGQASLSITNSQSLLKFISIESVMPSNHHILCHVIYSCLQSFPASGSFPVSQLFTSSGQNTGASASASVLPMDIQGWFPLGLTSLISLQSKGLSRVFSSTTI